MAEWRTYSLSDFLMFAPQTYYRLFELHNAAIWPAQIITMLASLALATIALRRPDLHRLACILLAAAWLWTGWTYLLIHYASINWVAPWLAGAFVLQAALLLLSAFTGGRAAHRDTVARPTGLGLLLFALAIQPLLDIVHGRGWTGVQLFGTTPDPTVMATLGLLLALGRARWLLLAIPLGWCAVSAATLWTMASPDVWVMPLGALITLLAAGHATLRRGSVSQR